MADDYLIWSNEHRAWWGPGRAGYVKRVAEAGRYSREEALDICTDAMPGTSRLIGMLPELPVRRADVIFMLGQFAGAFPGHDPEPSASAPDVEKLFDEFEHMLDRRDKEIRKRKKREP